MRALDVSNNLFFVWDDSFNRHLLAPTFNGIATFHQQYVAFSGQEQKKHNLLTH